MSFSSIFLSALSVVIYPSFMKLSKKYLISQYLSLNSLVLILTFLSISVYFPSAYFVNKYLPDYSNALFYFFILAPGLSLTASITTIKMNYFKAFSYGIAFFWISLLSLLTSLLLIFLGFNIWSSNIFVIIGSSLISLFIWYILTDTFIQKITSSIDYHNLTYITLSFVSFYSMSIIDNNVYSFIIYLILQIIIISIIHFKSIKRLIVKFVNSKY